MPLVQLDPKKLIEEQICSHCGNKFQSYGDLFRHLRHCRQKNIVKFFVIDSFLFVFIGGLTKPHFEALNNMVKSYIESKKNIDKLKTLFLGAVEGMHNLNYQSRFVSVIELDKPIGIYGMVSQDKLTKALEGQDLNRINQFIKEGYEIAKNVKYVSYEHGTIKRIIPENKICLGCGY